MATWLVRGRSRQLELAQGADTDLVQGNSRRSRSAFERIGLGVVLVVLTSAEIQLAHKPDVVFWTVAIISFVVGIVLARRAAAERAFLTEPGT